MTEATREDLYALFEANDITYKTTDHAPVFTVEESAEIKAGMPGGHTKNLFLKDKAGKLFLICALGDTQIKVNKLHPILACKRLSFGKPDLLLKHLGVVPGSVTLFSVMNDKEQNVTLVLDKALLDHDIVNFHPLKNNATTAVSKDDMLKFTEITSHTPIILDFVALQDAENTPS